MTTHEILLKAKGAKTEMSTLTTDKKNECLIAMADEIVKATAEILAANEKDMDAARGVLSDVMLDRLFLDEKRIGDIASGIKEVAALPDPVGEVRESFTRPNGLQIKKVSVPLGVVAIIYESRPNVTADSAALCLKSGNAAVLRTGKEAYFSARAIVDAMKRGMKRSGVTEDGVMLIEDTTRERSTEIMKARGLVDVLIPRGGKGLIEACVKGSDVPCIETGTGICHVYVDRDADQDMALNIIENAKCQRPSVCNAIEDVLVDEPIAKEFLPKMYSRLTKRDKPVTMMCDEKAFAILKGGEWCHAAGPEDYDTEFLDYKMGVKIVNGVEEATRHIAAHSTAHSDCIVTGNEATSSYFTQVVDSAAVYVNASTRFTDGGVFGLGCEIGISTQKLHARGPMGLKELTTYKYVISGDGQTR